MSRRTKTLLPTATNLLHPRVPENVGEKLKLKRQKAKWYHDRSARSLPEIDIGQEVRVAPLQRNETWTQGTCVDKLSDRSYMVKMDASNQLLRRNRELLKPAVKPAVPSEPVEGDKSQPVNNNTQPTVPEGKQLTPAPPPPAVKARTRVIKPPSRFSDYVT